MEGYLVAITNRCTGVGCDSHYGHHPDCGIEGVADADEALSPSSMWDFSNVGAQLEVIQ